MTAHGSTVVLSLNEEVTLRRVALGIARSSELSAADLAHLRELALVERDGANPRLTVRGRRHYNNLPWALPITDLRDQADYAGLLAKHIGDPGRR